MKLEEIQFTIQEIWAASRHLVHKNKKKYQRMPKHNKHEERKDS